MFSITRILFTLVCSLSLFDTAFTQTRQPNRQTLDPLVTATTSNGRVRYASLGEVNQTRLQVFAQDGTQVYDSEIRLGNLIDWSLVNQQGQSLTEGSYLFLITVKDFSGTLTQKFGTAVLEREQVSLQQTASEELSQPQALALQANKLAEMVSTIDRIGAVGSIDRIGAVVPNGPTIAADNRGIVMDSAPSSKERRATQPNPAGENLAGTGSQDRIAKWTDNAGTLGDSGITETGTGVGIGTTTPSALLDVTNNTNHLRYSPTTAKLTLTGPSANLTANPSLRLEFNSDPDPGLSYLAYSHDNISQAYDAYWNGTSWVSSHAGANFAIYKNVDQLAIGFNGGTPKGSTFPAFDTTTGVIFSNNGRMGIGGAPASAKLYVNGNVGIGTNNPQAKLDVSGDLNVTGNAVIAGNIAAKYQDVAEWVEARHPIAAGTVVSLDATRTNAVTPSRRAYDGLIAGVVSAQPGLILGEAGAGKVMVTMSGRVVVKVDASKYPIRIGDLLVTSNQPGVAMRSRPIRVGRRWIHRPGTIIGKALEALPRDKGEILVLVSLQ